MGETWGTRKTFGVVKCSPPGANTELCEVDQGSCHHNFSECFCSVFLSENNAEYDKHVYIVANANLHNPVLPCIITAHVESEACNSVPISIRLIILFYRIPIENTCIM